MMMAGRARHGQTNQTCWRYVSPIEGNSEGVYAQEAVVNRLESSPSQMSCRYRKVVDMGRVAELPRPYALAQLAWSIGSLAGKA